jgi:uncharacterized membrane protein YdbT with pleckstrin-like domain
MEESIDGRYELEPIRGSIVVLAVKLFLALILLETLYTITFGVLQIGLILPIEWHHHISVGLLIVGGIKVAIEVFFILYLLSEWTGNSYFITRKHIIRRTGVLQNKEEVFHFDNIRSISVEQSLLGKLFNYGNITLKTSASGGYQDDILLSGIDNPHKYETILKELF